MQRNRAFERDPATLWRSSVRGVLLKTVGEREPMLLTSPGDAVWRGLETPRTMAALVDLLTREFDAPSGRVEADIEPVLDELIERGAIRYTSDPSDP